MRSSLNKLHQNAALRVIFRSSSKQFDDRLAYMTSHDFNSNDHSVYPFKISVIQTRHASSKAYPTKLAEVGRFETKQADDDCYLPGQPFLHQLFGYRGVVLFPWLARVHDIDIKKQGKTTQHKNQNQQTQRHQNAKSPASDNLSNNNNKSDQTGFNNNSYKKRISNNNNLNNDKNDDTNQSEPITLESTIPISRLNANSTKFHPYYQVLIDSRDCPHVSNRTQTEAVTFLGYTDNSKSVYSIKGLDYVAHGDILPYTSYEQTPIQHDLHAKLFRFDQDNKSKTRYAATDLLDSWRNKHPWLELSRVYRETTENIRVTVIPFYLGHTTIEDVSFHWWRYCVRLENLSDTTVQLRERHWKIFSQTNMLQTIKGRGVVGMEPILSKSEPAYQYSSHVNLQDNSGHMWGSFKMQRDDGHTFECRIPAFSLESCLDKTTPPSSKRQS